ncbi:MAG: polymer-forming cytoskeletal protein [Flavobacteriaceae bacterium]|nr:polymer-forming cytoskeletal protein [Flavobacteriaceae bacterium]
MFTDKTPKPMQSHERNVIGQNTHIIGDIKSEGDFRIDGSVEGTISTSGRVVIGQQGKVTGKVTCKLAEIEGEFSGELIVNDVLTLKATSKITGEVTIGKLSVEPGASFNATCSMKGSVKELNHAKKDKKTA